MNICTENIVKWDDFLKEGYMIEDLSELHEDFYEDLLDWEFDLDDHGVPRSEVFTNIPFEEDFFGFFNELVEYILDEELGLNCNPDKLDFIKPEKREELIYILLSE